MYKDMKLFAKNLKRTKKPDTSNNYILPVYRNGI